MWSSGLPPPVDLLIEIFAVLITWLVHTALNSCWLALSNCLVTVISLTVGFPPLGEPAALLTAELVVPQEKELISIS